VKTVLCQETTTWQEGSDSVAGNGDIPPAPVSRARCSAFPAGFRASRSQGSLPDRNLGCSTHQAMSPLVQPGLHIHLLTRCSCASLQKLSSQSIRTSEPVTLSGRIYLYLLHDIVMDQMTEPAACALLSYFFCDGLESRGLVLTCLCNSLLYMQINTYMLVNTPIVVSSQIILPLICCHHKTSWTKTSFSHSG